MEFFVKNRSTLLDGDLNIIVSESSKDFLSYFNYQCRHFLEYVLPEEHERFLQLARGKESGRSDIFHLLRNTGEYRYNFVTFRSTDSSSQIRMQIYDIYDSINFVREADSQSNQMLSVLSITNEYFFRYNTKNNFFTICSCYQGRESLVCGLDLDKWRDYVIEEEIVGEEDMDELDAFIADLKACPARLERTFKAGIRSGSSIMELLDFSGIPYESMEGRFMVGRIMPSASANIVNHANVLLEELLYDGLTKVLNKKAITSSIKQRLKATSQSAFALVMVDLDHFKSVNDLLGHMEGDQVIMRAARDIKDVIGAAGEVGRFGGDEFMLMLTDPDIENEHVMRGMLQSVLNIIRREFKDEFDGISVTCSIGAALYPKDGTSYDELFQKADFCLYRAKEKGRNRYVFFRSDMHTQAYNDFLEAISRGKANEGRELRELQLMTHYIATLFSNGRQAVLDIMDHMVKAFPLSCIHIYWGEDLHSILSSGEDGPTFENASYAHSQDFLSELHEDRYVRLDLPVNVNRCKGTFLQALQERKILSSIQCIVGSRDKIKGLVCFDRTATPCKWADYEINCAVMFASSLTLIDSSLLKG